MILTVTLNPSVDISYVLDEFKINTVARCENAIKSAGGRGLNVTKFLKYTGEDVITTGFLGGELGQFIKRKLDENAIENHFIFTKRQTRNCIAIITKDSRTEIIENGEELSSNEIDAFMSRYEKLCTFISCVCISGSVPNGINSSHIEKLIQIAYYHNTKVVLDMSGQILLDTVNNFKYKPYAIKPNMQEFKSVIKKDIIDIKQDLLQYFKNIPLVMLSCSKDGSYIKFKEDVYKADVPDVKVNTPSGSGDAMVAGIAYSIENKLPIEETIKMANAFGVSYCMQQLDDIINLEQINDIKNKINVYRI